MFYCTYTHNAPMKHFSHNFIVHNDYRSCIHTVTCVSIVCTVVAELPLSLNPKLSPRRSHSVAEPSLPGRTRLNVLCVEQLGVHRSSTILLSTTTTALRWVDLCTKGPHSPAKYTVNILFCRLPRTDKPNPQITKKEGSFSIF